jgi:hypothetical protein
MTDKPDVHLIAAQLAAALIEKRPATKNDAGDAVDIYLEVLAALEEKAPGGRPKRPPMEFTKEVVDALKQAPRRRR